MFKIDRNLLLSVVACSVLLTGVAGCNRPSGPSGSPAENVSGTSAAPPQVARDTVTLTELQLKQVKVVPAVPFAFASQRETVGYIDFNQDRNVPVFSPWSGRIRQVAAKAGDDVKKGQPLFTIDSPDLVTAESIVISTAGIVALTANTLERARKMIEVQANAQKDLEQAISDHQTAEANYKAARNALRIFGKSDRDMDQIVASRKVNGELVIASPINGRVTARAAAPGLLVQPGTAPAPFTVADLSTMWMVANVAEYEFPQFQLGQSVAVSMLAYPSRKFVGEVANIGAAVDPNTHRIAVRSEIKDPRHELRPQMLASLRVGRDYGFFRQN